MAAHEQFAEDLALLALGALPAGECAPVRAHLEDCPDCRAEFRKMVAATSALALSVEGPTPPAHTLERLQAALEEEPRVTSIVQSKPRWWALAPLFSTALLAVIAIMLWQENASQRDAITQMTSDLTLERKRLKDVERVLVTLT